MSLRGASKPIHQVALVIIRMQPTSVLLSRLRAILPNAGSKLAVCLTSARTGRRGASVSVSQVQDSVRKDSILETLLLDARRGLRMRGVITCDPLIAALEGLLAQLQALSGSPSPGATGLDWNAVKSEVTGLLDRSQEAQRIFVKIDGRFRMWPLSAAEAAQKMPNRGEIAVTGRDGGSGQVMFNFVPSRMSSVYKAVVVLAHEFGHVEQALDRDFTNGEAAPFYSFDDYKWLRLFGELDAFQTQYLVTKEIIQDAEKQPTVPSGQTVATAMKRTIAEDAVVEELDNGNLGAAKAVIESTYTEAILKRRYLLDRPHPDQTRKAAVDAYRHSSGWRSAADW
jgi:hypothetical protein